MKLLFDENLSYKLVRLLADLFPDSIHVRDVGLKAAEDSEIWKYAQDNSFIICSKDSDPASAKFSVGVPSESYLGSIRQLFYFGCRDVASKTRRDDKAVRRR
jgi:predicted nuclease of predicted toxin-antitoxin system